MQLPHTILKLLLQCEQHQHNAHLICSDVKQTTGRVVRSCGKRVSIREELKEKIFNNGWLGYFLIAYRNSIYVTLMSSKGLFAVAITHIPELQTKYQVILSNNKNSTCLPQQWHHRHQTQRCSYQGIMKCSSHHQCAHGMKLSAGYSQCPTVHCILITAFLLMHTTTLHNIQTSKYFKQSTLSYFFTMSCLQSWSKSCYHQRTGNLTNILAYTRNSC